METYIGFDISLQTTHICVVDRDGGIVLESSAESEIPSLERWLCTHGCSWTIKRIVFETGQLSTHIYHGLKAAGHPVVCIDARHAHGTLKAQRIKSDRNDARGLAHIARTGWFKASHVKSDSCQALRTLVTGRKQLVHTRLSLENHIRGTLKTFGIKLGAVTSAGFSKKVRGLISGRDEVVEIALSAMLDARDGVWAQERALDRQSQKRARRDVVCKRLMTIPGVGVATALAFMAEIDDPGRFKHSRDVGVHLGLTPRRYASGEVDYTGRISKCGNGTLRTLLFEAAAVMLTRSAKWSRLKAWGVRLAQRSSFKAACTALARKLAVVMHRMWVDETEFAYGQAPSLQAA